MKKTVLLALIFLEAIALVVILNLTVISAFRRGITTAFLLPSLNLMEMKRSFAGARASGKVLGSAVVAGDARSLILERFIKRYQPNSPFLAHVNVLMAESDEHHLDFRLIPAIAMCESNLGARLPSSDSFNAWGIAVYTNTNKGKHFEGWPEAIAWVAKFIEEKFYNRGITDLFDIGAIWAPPSVANNYSWSRCVQGFIDKMQ